MLIDFRKYPEAAAHQAEFCVIGAGAAGVTIARRLMRAGKEVMLLESGGPDFEAATQELYRGANIGLPYYDLDEARPAPDRMRAPTQHAAAIPSRESRTRTV